MVNTNVTLKLGLLLIILFALLVGCEKNPTEVLKKASKCLNTGQYDCAEENYRWLVKKKPNDNEMKASLAVALTEQGKYEEAITLFKELINSGEGSYAIFAYFSKSLSGAGQVDDAITWSYRALLINPDLVYIRRDLATLLVKKDRKYEALSLLASYDNELEIHGRSPYFRAQAISIESLLPATDASNSETIESVKLNGHFYVVVLSQKNEAFPFLVDTGASYTSMSPKMIESLGLTIPYDAQAIPLQTADKRSLYGKLFIAPEIKVGPYTLRNIEVVVCDNCSNLIGQSTLAKFDLSTHKANGLEVLSVRLRSPQ